MNLFYVVCGGDGNVYMRRKESSYEEWPPEGAIPKGGVYAFPYEEAVILRDMHRMGDVIKLVRTGKAFSSRTVDGQYLHLRDAKIEAEEIMEGLSSGSLTKIPLMKKLRRISRASKFAFDELLLLYLQQKEEIKELRARLEEAE